MSNNKSTRYLLVLVALLLAANLIRPLFEPTVLHADERPGSAVALSASGNIAWVLKGSKIYHIQFQQQYESIRVYGPEDLDD